MKIQSTLDRVGDYNELYDQVLEQVGDKDVALGLIHEAAKDRRMDVIRQIERGKANYPASTNGDEATPKQIGWLKSRGVKIAAGLTKSGASEMIDEIKAKE
jgi:hypothetical protein